MWHPAFTGRFKRDFRRAVTRGWHMEHLEQVMTRLIAGESLEARYSCHPLRGGFAGHWECHVGPDVLLIWYYGEDDTIVFVRVGTHSDLFG